MRISAWAIAIAIAGPVRAETGQAKSLLVGVYLNQQEVDSLEILQVDSENGSEPSYFIPLNGLSRLIGVRISIASPVTITTPLGQVTLEPQDVRQINGVAYILDRTLQKRLAVQVRFSARDYALYVQVPWQSSSAQSLPVKVQPDVQPPENSFSHFRSSMTINALGNNGISLANSLNLGGDLGGGSWQAQIDYSDLLQSSNSWQNPRLTQYSYQGQLGNLNYQLGKQQVQIHPLLQNVDLTGLQVAASDRNNSEANGLSGNIGLLPRRSSPRQSFHGQAPPASLVQLRIDGIILEQQQTQLNGQYHFSDVPLSIGDNRQVEILIFDRRNLRVPLEIRSARLNVTDLLLPEGQASHLGGVGWSGNLLNALISNGSSTAEVGQPVGFYQWRQGVSKDFTVEAAVQKVPSGFQGQAGAIWRFNNPWILELGGVTNDQGDLGYQMNLLGNLARWRVQLNSQYIPKGLQSSLTSSTPDRQDKFNHGLEASYEFDNTLRLGAIARIQQDRERRTEYILPSFHWRPSPKLSLRGRPDSQGIYYTDANYQPNSSSQLSLFSAGETATLNLRYDMSEQYQINAGADTDRTLSPRYFAFVSRSGYNPSDLSISLGASTRDGELGIIAGASLELWPGVLSTLRYQSQNSFASSSSASGQNLQILVSTDFSINQGQVQPARNGSIDRSRGAVSGRLVLEANSIAPQVSLEGSLVTASLTNSPKGNQVDHLAVRTNDAGNFFLGGLSPGIYIIELVPENLPAHLTLTKNRIIAEIKAGTTTYIDFPMRAAYGIAGRITGLDGQPLVGITVELTNAQGQQVGTTVSNEFGLYRMDQIPSGRYFLGIIKNGLSQGALNSPKRIVEIQQDFLFGQDIQIVLRGH